MGNRGLKERICTTYGHALREGGDAEDWGGASQVAKGGKLGQV